VPLYEMSDAGLERQPVSTFKALGLYERADLQARLRDDISPLGDDLLVVGEEFGEWEDARRRIDLLALDKQGRLVVIELKRTDDGGHMELQAIRYAAMVSSMSFNEVATAYEKHCAKHRANENVDSRADLVEFLGTPAGDEPVISTTVRIVLVSADFGREITTAVLWLNLFDGMDIRCVRLVPYEVSGAVLLDVQQVIPLPEAADYQVQLRRKDAVAAKARADGKDYTRYHIVVDGEILPDENKRHAVRVMVEQLAQRGAALPEIRNVLPPPVVKVLPGQLHDGPTVEAALSAAYPNIDLKRWFVDHPFVDVDADQTYVLFNNWGVNTETTLAALTERFPETNVTFIPADAGTPF
jgi:hypothetical protein